MSKPGRLGRRTFLAGVGGTTLAVPLLPSLFPESSAHAGGSEATRNFISWRITNGMFGHHWFPAATAVGGLQLVEPNVREMALSEIAGPISPLLDASFDPFRDRMNLLRHIDRLDLGDHDNRTGLFGWADEEGLDTSSLPPSIDQLIAKRAFANTVIPLNLGVRWSESGVSCSVSKTAQGGVVDEPSLYPDQAFAQLFAGFNVDDLTAVRYRQQKVTLVDRALEHYGAVRSNTRLSAADRDVLDEHIEHMHQLESQLANGALDCAPPQEPSSYVGTPEAVNDNAQAVVDIAIAALRCGLTQVVNIYLDPDVLMTQSLHGVEGGHHGASHDASGVDSIFNAHRWHMGYFNDFLQKLDASLDPLTGGSMLDSSLVLLNNEIGNQSGQGGTDPTDLDTNHIVLDNQVLLVGSCGGKLRTGMYLDYRTDFTRNRWSEYVGTSYNWVLITCMLAMGLQPDDWEVGGQPGYGDMRGAMYDMTPLDQVVIGDLRTYLPRLEA